MENIELFMSIAILISVVVGLLFFVSGVSVADVTEKNDSSWCEDHSGQFGASAGAIIAGKANEYGSRCRP